VKQAPAWNRVTAAFKNNGMVAFGDVNLAEAPIGAPYFAGAGGWPTVRYFNKETGVAGAPYKKKTDGAMCDELGNDEYMTQCVTEYGMTSACELSSGDKCTDREIDFAGKWKGKPADDISVQLTRLRGMAGGSMKTELKQWLGMRINALTQLLVGAPATKAEL